MYVGVFVCVCASILEHTMFFVINPITGGKGYMYIIMVPVLLSLELRKGIEVY